MLEPVERHVAAEPLRQVWLGLDGDDASGIDFKAFGARTILERFESTGRLRLVDEASRELYRISVGEVDVAVVDRV